MPLLSLTLICCGVKLPSDYHRRSLDEEVYVENIKNDYTLHVGKNSGFSEIRVQGDSTRKVLQQGDSLILFTNRKERPFFSLVRGSDTVIVSNRQIYFRQAVNFRDIGGIKTQDGKTVKWGKIFRSDNLSGIKTSEFEKLSNLHIHTVFDLRTVNETKGKEDHLPESITYIHSPTIRDKADLLTQLKPKVLNGELTEAQSIELTLQLYRDNVSKNLPELRQLMHQILDSNEPVLYHCSAGKDRTGILTALILSILNVDREIIFNEYMLSNYYRSDKIEKMLGKAKLLKVIKPHLNLQVIENFMQVDKRYLSASFEVIDQQYGGINPFIRNELGINDQQRSEIIKKLTYQ